MRGKKAKALRNVIKRQIDKMASSTTLDLMETKYQPSKKFAKQFMAVIDGRITPIPAIMHEPIELEFCFRRAYQSLKYTLKQSGKIKNVKSIPKIVKN